MMKQQQEAKARGSKKKKKTPLRGICLDLDVNLINDPYEDAITKKQNFMADTTYRGDGFSIGQDYLRLEGQTISRGELLPSRLQMDQLIGEGAFSQVYKGRWKQQQKQKQSGEEKEVAIKKLCLIDESDQRRGMILKELRALCNVDCECLVKLQGAFLEDASITMVIEYMDQGSMEKILNDNKMGNTKVLLNESFVAAMAFQVLWGLSYLHHDKILHRDIKPGNVLIHSDGSVKLCDFGLASLTGQTLQTTMVGTSRYMSPERLRAHPYGPSSDIWSFGIFILQCFTNKIPWQDYDTDSIVSLLVTIEETSPEELIPISSSKDVKDFLLGCLQHIPEKRIPACLLLRSPWFAKIHNILDLTDSKRAVKKFAS